MDIRAEELLRKQVYDLNERNKELNCLYAISETAAERFISSESMLVKIAAIISNAWQYPDITCAQIKLHDQEYSTENFKDSPWKQPITNRVPIIQQQKHNPSCNDVRKDSFARLL